MIYKIQEIYTLNILKIYLNFCFEFLWKNNIFANMFLFNETNNLFLLTNFLYL